MSFLLNSQDLRDQKISNLLMKNSLNIEAPISIKKNSKLIDKNELYKYINRSKKKKCTVCPKNNISSLSSSVQSTLNTINSISFKDNTKLNKFLKDLSNTNLSKIVDSGKRQNKRRLTKPKDDDMKFLYKILFNYEEESTIQQPSAILRKPTSKTFNNKERYDEKFLRSYIIKNQTEFNEGGDVLIARTSNNVPFLIDYYIMKKLEDLIARYSLIIFLFIKIKNFIEAKKIFLLMIKENIKYFNYIEKKIIFSFSLKDKTHNKSKDNYKMVYQLIKIYSFIIRYSQIFNTMNNRNKFLEKYFRLINSNFQFFLNLSNCHGINNELPNYLNYWISFYLSYVNYFSILHYSPSKIPITLNNMILSLYKNIDEYSLTTMEKKLLLNTEYNQGLIFYMNNQEDEALFNLKQAEKNIKILENNQNFSNDEYISSKKKGLLHSNYSLKNLPIFDISEKKKFSYKSNIPIKLWRKAKLNEQNGYISGKTMNLIKSMKSSNYLFSNHVYEDIENICKNFSKSNIEISNIISLIEYGIDKKILNNIEINDLDKTLSFCQQSETIIRNSAFRKSQIIRSSRSKLNDIQYPKYLIDPLLIKTELLICEIEINKKNIKEAYKYVLKSFFLLILIIFSKIFDYKNIYNRIQKILIGYLKLIDELCDEKMLSSQSYSDTILSSNGQLIYFNNNYEENKRNTNDETIIKEFEKFFIFLSSLSVYQIKVLNDSQPQNQKRNDLPIFFSTQFKDSLSNLQRLQLRNLQTMALSRFIILRNPNRWIIPSNLNTSLLHSIKKQETVKSTISMNYINSLGGLNIYALKNYQREYNNYKKILSSKKVTEKIKEFLNKNIEYVLIILKKSTDEEINYMMSNPLLLVHPIKRFIKKNEKKVNIDKGIDNMIISDYFDNGMKTIPKFQVRRSSKPFTQRFGLNRFSNADYLVGNKKNKVEYKKCSNKYRRRNKSTGNFLIAQIPNFIENMKQCSFINDEKGTKDYNDSYEDYKLSIDCSFYDD